MESVVLLIRAGRIAVELLEKEIVPLAISVPQLSIVISLYEWGEMTASRLCEITMRDKANISSLLKKLETAGLVQMKKNTSDARSSFLSLTAKGKNTAELGLKAEAKVSKQLQKMSNKHPFPKEFLVEMIQKNSHS
ncbi:MarR family winged helix-turn-helix transcriptional regulator [Leptospira ognonensis]|nr:MarR family transcriptional regulator [Leptospira ognonensis]